MSYIILSLFMLPTNMSLMCLFFLQFPAELIPSLTQRHFPHLKVSFGIQGHFAALLLLLLPWQSQLTSAFLHRSSAQCPPVFRALRCSPSVYIHRS
ncbi:hypothetical protein BDR03DRAFT_186988 [Suillus americanus]|nr:hypothetical protein BDR03DRAFT_186988 [Suillus americanus]